MFFMKLHLAGDEPIIINAEHITSIKEFHIEPDDTTINSVVLLTGGKELEVIETWEQIMDVIP